MSAGSRERVLLIHPGALGDLIQAFPVFGMIRKELAGSHLSLLVGSPFATVARESGLFDEVLAFDMDTFYHGATLRRAALMMGIAARVRRLAPHRVAVFRGAPVYAAFARASGAPVRVGVTRGVGARFLTASIEVEPLRHREDRYLDVARMLGIRGGDVVDARWAPLSLPLPPKSGPWVGMSPGGARNVKEEMPARRWATARYAELGARLLAARPDARVVLLGGGGDRAEAEVVKAALPEGCVIDLVGRTSVAEARGVIDALDAYVAHDSGLLHVAGTTNTPVIAIFGPTDPGVASPRGAHVTTVWNPACPTPCHDEMNGQLRPCAALCCIDRVTVDDVWSLLAPALPPLVEERA